MPTLVKEENKVKADEKKVLLVLRNPEAQWLDTVSSASGLSKTRIIQYLLHAATQQPPDSITSQLRKGALENELRENELEQKKLSEKSQGIRDELIKLGKK